MLFIHYIVVAFLFPILLVCPLFPGATFSCTRHVQSGLLQNGQTECNVTMLETRQAGDDEVLLCVTIYLYFNVNIYARMPIQYSKETTASPRHKHKSRKWYKYFP